MEPLLKKNRFIIKFGRDKYIEFVLSLYESFPIRNRLFYWQEQLLNELSNDLNIQQISFEETYLIFDSCPIHDSKLEKDIVPILNGNQLKSNSSHQIDKKQFPLANNFALRDLDRFKYPDRIDVLYCPDCRQRSSEDVNE